MIDVIRCRVEPALKERGERLAQRVAPDAAGQGLLLHEPVKPLRVRRARVNDRLNAALSNHDG